MSTDPQLRIVILADDLTSAADGAGPFVMRGLASIVGRQAVPDGSAQVCAVDVASRSMTAALAARRMAHFAEGLRAADFLFKTVDSTLRGHVEVEIAAALRGSGRTRVVFAPAFPEMSRTTEDGVQFVDGVPVDRSPYGSDPVHPARTAKLADLVAPDAGQVVLFNARSQADLDRQVAGIRHPEQVLWVGSPGLARALAKRIAPEAPPQPVRALPSGPLLVVVGSANAVSHRQADFIRGRDKVTVLSAPVERGEDPAVVLAALAGRAMRALGDGTFGALFATGGETMNAILDQFGIRQFDLLGEIAPGIPVGRAWIADRALMLGMKAGGFGDDETLRLVADRLTQHAKELES